MSLLGKLSEVVSITVFGPIVIQLFCYLKILEHIAYLFSFGCLFRLDNFKFRKHPIFFSSCHSFFVSSQFLSSYLSILFAVFIKPTIGENRQAKMTPVFVVLYNLFRK